MTTNYSYIWQWNKWPTSPDTWTYGNRKGQRCRVIIRSRRMNVALIEFEDGYQVVTSRNGLRKFSPRSHEGHEEDPPTRVRFGGQGKGECEHG